MYHSIIPDPVFINVHMLIISYTNGIYTHLHYKLYDIMIKHAIMNILLTVTLNIESNTTICMGVCVRVYSYFVSGTRFIHNLMFNK